MYHEKTPLNFDVKWRAAGSPPKYPYMSEYLMLAPTPARPTLLARTFNALLAVPLLVCAFYFPPGLPGPAASSRSQALVHAATLPTIVFVRWANTFQLVWYGRAILEKKLWLVVLADVVMFAFTVLVEIDIRAEGRIALPDETRDNAAVLWV